MELRNLKAFVEVVRQGGFSRAARTLFSTQSTVSKAVGQLEAECGEALLERLGTGVRLTAAGELVYARALAMLAESEHLAAELADLRGLLSGRLRLGLPIFGSARLFAPLFAEYRSRWPNVEIELMEQGSARLEEALTALSMIGGRRLVRVRLGSEKASIDKMLAAALNLSEQDLQTLFDYAKAM